MRQRPPYNCADMVSPPDAESSRRKDERGLLKVAIVVTLFWLVPFSPQWLFWEKFDILGVIATLGGIGLAIAWFIMALCYRSIRILVLSGAVALLCVGVFNDVPNRVLARVTLAKREASYMKAVCARLEMWTEVETGEQVLIDNSGGTVKVGFLFGNSLYNDGAIVYDPSGEVARPGRTQPLKIFGGTLASVDHLRDSWYYCRLILD